MTLIAGFLKNECPILIGDLLISSSEESNTELILPTLGKISSEHISKGQYRPSNLCQKVNILSPRLAIAWAGTKIYATHFIKEVIAAGVHENPSRDSLEEIYHAIGGQEEVQILGILRDGKEMGIFSFNSWPVDQPPGFRWFRGAGSGYRGLLDIVPTLNSTVTNGVLNKLEQGVSAAIGICTALLSYEIITLLPLKELYGAGYEICHPLGSGLAKFDNLTYIFWRADEDSPDSWRLLPFPTLAAKYSYHGDVLIIRSVKLSSVARANSCRIESDILHVISPTHEAIRADHLVGYRPESLNSKRVCNVFLWRNYQGQTGAFCTYGHYADKPPPVIWKNEFTENEGIDVNFEFIKDSVSKLASQFRSGDLEGGGRDHLT